MTIALTDTVQRTDDVVSSKVDSEVVMMSITNGKYFAMNELASRIWELISEPVQVSAVVQTLRSEFEVSATQCEQEVLNFINQLSDLGILNQRH